MLGSWPEGVGPEEVVVPEEPCAVVHPATGLQLQPGVALLIYYCSRKMGLAFSFSEQFSRTVIWIASSFSACLLDLYPEIV